MRLRIRALGTAIGLIALLTGAVIGQQGGVGGQQQDPVTVTQPIPPDVEPEVQQAAAAAILEYWTPERMASAQPMPFPTRVAEDSPQQEAAREITGDPGWVNGGAAGGGAYVENRTTFSLSDMLVAPQTFGVAPTNPRDGPYGPFQRWTMEGNYLGGFRDIHGKLFFSLPGGNFVCSGSVIGRSTVATAGHCNSNGAGTFATNRMFCPAYYNPTPATGAPHPNRGCWAVTTSAVGGPWHFGGDPDYDYACLVTNVTGTVHANKIGNITSWAGRAWNFVDVPEMVFGYPQAAPFIGNTIQQVAAPDWYNWDATAGNQVSKVIGSDMTGGSSGGGWFLGWRAPGAEIPDTDGSWATDPTTAGPYINGVNSHKRCRTNCNNPPTTTAGVFWQEMTSPPFRSNANDASDSEDVFAICLAHVNNN
jgi:hypothetical protein